ncbi:hypothetical protein F5876DRAFT_73351 [Lentinula aff. lateritia]|uniref:Uncharacterized protein n=1 Tax=Lentinula aff. lateritia TaxID=2804960 RepID=A0ACC1UA40_9AGAR|nr:hypothetical protein F5876DRAFT_73351 [Lentinula aff. lateritia]
MWNAHVTAQALKRGYEEVSGEDEDPAITHRKRQKCKKLKNVLAEGSHPQSSIITVNSTQVTASSSAVTLEQSGESRVLETPGHITPRVLLTPKPNMFNAGIDGHPNGPEPVPTEMTAAGRPIRSSRGHLPACYLDVIPPSAPIVGSLQTLLAGWQNNGNLTKSNNKMDGLAHILQWPDFQVKELEGYNVQAANEKITKADQDWGCNQFKDSFIETAVEIEVPSVIRAAFADQLASQFYFVPFKLFQEIDSDDGKTISQHVQTGLYNLDVFLEEHKNLCCAPTDDKNCKQEKVVAALMCWSDAMQLANFGTAKLWPIYMLFGNLSKYVCASPNSGAVHHLTYIPTIPDSVKHEISKFNVNWKTQAKEIIAHCNRELYHAVWRFLLNDVFLHAYKYGIVIKCFNGVECRIYPRFFTYSADYPEK